MLNHNNQNEPISGSLEGLWTPQQVAGYLKVSRSWVYQKDETGLIPVIRMPGSCLLRFGAISDRLLDVLVGWNFLMGSLRAAEERILDGMTISSLKERRGSWPRDSVETKVDCYLVEDGWKKRTSALSIIMAGSPQNLASMTTSATDCIDSSGAGYHPGSGDRIAMSRVVCSSSSNSPAFRAEGNPKRGRRSSKAVS